MEKYVEVIFNIGDYVIHLYLVNSTVAIKDLEGELMAKLSVEDLRKMVHIYDKIKEVVKQ